MVVYFEIETDRAIIRWAGPADGIRDSEHWSGPTSNIQHPGRLKVIPLKRGLHPTIRAIGFPEYIAGGTPFDEGPRLFEQITYHVSVHPKDFARVELQHRDPTVVRFHATSPRGDLVGSVNFGSQVGLSCFRVIVDGEPEVDFEVEVFPSKIDYKSDYDQMLAEVSNFLMGLALEYLRATYRAGDTVRAPRPSDVEWLTILRQVWSDLERALFRIRERPTRRLIRHERLARPDRIRRVDSAVRRAISRGQGRGGRQLVQGVGLVREYIHEQRPIETLDTPEHRWLRSQLQEIRYRLADLIQEESRRVREAGSGGRRSEAALLELREMEERISQLLKMEPLAEAVGEPPANFASLVLQAAPGYREAYITCLILRLGLRLEGGPLDLSLKDIAVLYEYWCYLSVLKILAEETGVELDPRQIFRVTSRGLKVDLEKGRTKQIVLESQRKGHKEKGKPTKVTLAYNPRYRSATTTHQPDVGLAITVDGWERPFELIFDAKYRLDTSGDYQARYGSPGPPEDAVNALHRYRDAILVTPLEETHESGEVAAAPARLHDSVPFVSTIGSLVPQQRIVFGAALFPYQDVNGTFRKNRFWRSLASVGIGALPFLPNQMEYVREWLKTILRQSGWSFSDQVIEHWSASKRLQWVKEASEPVLIAVLRPGVGHLEWIKERRLYYAPLGRLGPRRFAAKWIAFFQSRKDRGTTGAVTHEAPIIGIEVMRRRDIETPWPTRRDPDELQIVYRLGHVRERAEPIEVSAGIRGFRWGSRLSLNRARQAHELYLETEPEWRLYDELRARGLEFQLYPGEVRNVDPDDVKGRARFLVGKETIRYHGAAGFRIEGERVIYRPTVGAVLRYIAQ